MRHYFQLSKVFLLKRVMSRFSVEDFCVRVSKIFVGEKILFFIRTLVSEKLLDEEEEGRR